MFRLNFSSRIFRSFSVRKLFSSTDFDSIRCSSSKVVKEKLSLEKLRNLIRENDPSNLTENDLEPEESFTCLQNELILTNRFVQYPFNFRSVLEEQLDICDDRFVSKDEWKQLDEKIGNETKNLFGSITMHTCLKLKHVERGRSLFQYLEENQIDSLKSTVTTCANYLNLLSLNFFSETRQFDKEKFSPNQDEIIRVFEQFILPRKQVRFVFSPIRSP